MIASVDGDDLILELARGSSGNGALMRPQGKLILLPPGDAKLFGKQLGGLAHDHAVGRIGQAFLQRDYRLEMPGPEFGDGCRSLPESPGLVHVGERLDSLGGKQQGDTVLIDSTPPARMAVPLPVRMRAAASAIASMPEAQLRCTVIAGTSYGIPA